MKKYSNHRKWKTRIFQALLVLVILYCVSSINVLLLALGIVRWIPRAYLNPRILIGFSIISFGLALLLSAYHFYTFITSPGKGPGSDPGPDPGNPPRAGEDNPPETPPCR
jgi:hypothetical protein